MGWSESDIRRNREYFQSKLHATKARSDVVKAIEQGTVDFVLLDTRGREPFAFGHIAGAWCAPLEELEAVASRLPKDKEIVTYCWGHDCHLSAKAGLFLAERGFYAKELNVGWKEWTANKHPTHASRADGLHCTCSMLVPQPVKANAAT